MSADGPTYNGGFLPPQDEREDKAYLAGPMRVSVEGIVIELAQGMRFEDAVRWIRTYQTKMLVSERAALPEPGSDKVRKG